MAEKWFSQEGQQMIVHTRGGVCCTGKDILTSGTFMRLLELYCRKLIRQQAPILDYFPLDLSLESSRQEWAYFLQSLGDNPLQDVINAASEWAVLLTEQGHAALHEFVEGIYDFWREFDRFLVLHGAPGPSSLDRRPYRAFNATVENLTHVVRALYRDVCENITGGHPRIYRQVSAGCDVGLIAIGESVVLPGLYHELLSGIPFIRQVWISPPLITDPSMNTRSGQFVRVQQNPLHGLTLDAREWLCYPAQVGPLLVHVYFHQRFISLGTALANLFELAEDEHVTAKPDAIYIYGADPVFMARFGAIPTIFYDDKENDLLVGIVPGEDRFGYFGYLKKMCLTLHNIVMMKRGFMPFHGALCHIHLITGESANILLIGDTATGKSETLEALRLLGKEVIREIRVVADDMGSLKVNEKGQIIGYGTEVGAFIRLDDLQRDYAFRQIDRAILMSPQKVNARVVLPITTIDEVLKGREVDFIFYANNYEELDDMHPVLDQFTSLEHALMVFRSGAAMGKGTTTAHGLGHSYFANIFGPVQYRELHDGIAKKVFAAALQAGVWMGEMRTRLGIAGFESQGPHAAAEALLALIRQKGV